MQKEHQSSAEFFKLPVWEGWSLHLQTEHYIYIQAWWSYTVSVPQHWDFHLMLSIRKRTKPNLTFKQLARSCRGIIRLLVPPFRVIMLLEKEVLDSVRDAQ